MGNIDKQNMGKFMMALSILKSLGIEDTERYLCESPHIDICLASDGEIMSAMIKAPGQAPMVNLASLVVGMALDSLLGNATTFEKLKGMLESIIQAHHDAGVVSEDNTNYESETVSNMTSATVELIREGLFSKLRECKWDIIEAMANDFVDKATRMAMDSTGDPETTEGDTNENDVGDKKESEDNLKEFKDFLDKIK